MKRRDLLVGSAAMGAGGALVSCAPAIPPAAPLLASPEEVAATWRRIESTRDAFGKNGPVALDGIVANGRSEGRVWNRDEVATKAARTLFVAGAFRDLPLMTRTHPDVQDAMFDALPEFDEAILGMNDRLAKLTPTERADLSREFRKDPELAERVLSLLDGEAARADVSEIRRLHLRKIGVTVCDRLAQSSDLLIDEYTRKLEKIYARPASEEELERKIASVMGQEAFDELRATTLEAAAAYQVAGAMRIGPPPKRMSATKRNLFISGGVFMGLAVIAAVLTPVTFFIGATVGGVFLVTGLVLLIVGAAIS